ncbi:uncharacterized protein LOC132621784 [Lycium barbarum]|uniref:uncharacterized protein LOC132621784 n=1 Tax=Lycium barbarum TaxID=112863 RepID=UPI00293E3A12|nr:uncharacterized protein LOC132621784 [Lycium barbarum]
MDRIGQSSQSGWMNQVGTSSAYPITQNDGPSSSFGAVDSYWENIVVAPNYRQRPAMDSPNYPNYIVTSSSDSEEIPNAEESEDEESDDEVQAGTNPQYQLELLQDMMNSSAQQEELNSQHLFEQQESTPVQPQSQFRQQESTPVQPQSQF